MTAITSVVEVAGMAVIIVLKVFKSKDDKVERCVRSLLSAARKAHGTLHRAHFR